MGFRIPVVSESCKILKTPGYIFVKSFFFFLSNFLDLNFVLNKLLILYKRIKQTFIACSRIYNESVATSIAGIIYYELCNSVVNLYKVINRSILADNISLKKLLVSTFGKYPKYPNKIEYELIKNTNIYFERLGYILNLSLKIRPYDKSAKNIIKESSNKSLCSCTGNINNNMIDR